MSMYEYSFVRTQSTIKAENTLYIARPTSVVTGVRTLTKDPSYKLKIRNRTDASLPYTYRSYDAENAIPYHIFGSATQSGTSIPPYRRSFEFDFRGYPRSLTLPVSPLDDALSDVALARLKKKLNSSLNRVNQLIPAVELREMRGMIRSMAEESIHVAYNLALIAAKAKKQPKAVVRSIRQEFQRVWLTYSFGIAPTIGAVQALCEQIEQKITDRPPALRLYAGSRKDWVSSGVANGIFMNYWQLQVNMTHYHQLTFRYTCGFDPSVLSANNYGIAAQYGTQLKDLPSVGWELTPFSWMIDYFSNMSAFLDDTFTCPPGFVTYCVLSKKYSRRTVLEPSMHRNTLDIPGFTSSMLAAVPLSGEVAYNEMIRTKVGSIPHLGLHFKSVDQIAKNAVSKLLNVCSLVKSGRPIHSLK